MTYGVWISLWGVRAFDLWVEAHIDHRKVPLYRVQEGFCDQKDIQVFELNLNKGWVVKVSTSPMGFLSMSNSNIFYLPSIIYDGDCIYIGNNEAPWICYSLATQEWFG